MRLSIEQYTPDIQNFAAVVGYREPVSATSNPHRLLAGAFGLCAVAICALIAAHPGGSGHTITEILHAEARDQFIDTLVHGGFIVISALLMVCMAGLTRILASSQLSVTVGLVTFCLGAGALMMSMALDGLVIPAIAVHCLSEGTTQALASARTLLLFCGTCIRILMPMGLMFEGAGMLSYSVAMLVRGWFPVGGFGVTAGVVMLSGPLLLSSLGPHLLIGAIAASCVWYVGIAATLLSKAGTAN